MHFNDGENWKEKIVTLSINLKLHNQFKNEAKNCSFVLKFERIFGINEGFSSEESCELLCDFKVSYVEKIGNIELHDM